MICGIFEDPSSPYQLGMPHWSAEAWKDYMGGLGGERGWKVAEASMLGKFGGAATEDASDPRWREYGAGTHEVVTDLPGKTVVNEVLVRMLNCRKDGIVPPSKLFLFSSMDGEKWSLEQIKDSPRCADTRHDAFIDFVLFDGLDCDARHLKIAFTTDSKSYMDEVTINPEW